MRRSSFDSAGALAVLKEIAAVMERNKELLLERDRTVGDGDLGLTMAAGFSGAAKAAEAAPETEPGKLWLKAGMAINRHAPSTMGTLMATGFMRGGKALAGKAEAAAPEMAVFFQAFLEGVLERGKAKPGDKTVVDAILPAAEAARAAAGKELSDALADTLAGARRGLEEGKKLMSQHGKAAVFREKTIGLEDPGSLAFCLVVEGFLAAVSA
ncbi:MAG: DAK2 domain-containing protein [Planctomycetota bacterium]|jgi:dihydroxyacetone kinase-like protein|nr:DAK2 domain-containing protein [Planctomycetota bacterium]